MIRDNREYRDFDSFEFNKPEEEEEESYMIEGYALVWDKPYRLFTDEKGNEYYEIISRSSFDETTDLSDVILQMNHEGMVYARNKNNTLQLINDEHGLKFIADLSSTKATKELWHEIKAGLMTKCSWGFKCDGEDYDSKTRTRTVTHIKKVYDVSIVSIPANEETMVFTRSLIDGYVEKERLDLIEREHKENLRQKIRILAEM